jgi:hypothetical protein
MSRIRTIKPGFFASEDMARLPMRARLTFAGLWTYADDYGRANANPKLIKAAIWSLDDEVTAVEIQEDLDALAVNGQLALYSVGGRSYLRVVKWSSHQRVDRPSKSDIPADSSEAREDSASQHESLAQEGEGKGGEKEGEAPPRRCPEHLASRFAPKCGNCKEARLDHEQWVKDHPPATKSGIVTPTNICPVHEYPFPCKHCENEAAA